MKRGVVILLILIFSVSLVSAGLWSKITGRAIEDFECSVDATNCIGLDYDKIMYGLISTQDVWDGYEFTLQKVCTTDEGGGVSSSWSFEQPGCAIIKELISNNCIKCPDLNEDGVVNNEDSVLFYACAGEGTCPNSYDLNEDGIISILSDVDCLNDSLDKTVNEIEVCELIPECTDSDGEDYYTKGIAIEKSDNVYKYEDVCTENVLSEGICREGVASYISYTCLNGCENGGCIKKINDTCLDGTKYGECSTNKPKYCQEGILVSKCELCGCSNGKICLNDGGCQNYNSNKQTISIFIDESTYNSLTSKINRFREDIMNDWDVNVFIFYDTWNDEEGIRDILKNIYEDFRLSGVIFIGEIPYRLVTNSPTGDYPSDAFYRDFYNKCDYDSNGNIVSDSLWTKCFFGDPWNYNGFWIGRIKPPVSGEQARNLLKSYFDRNHEYRIGNKLYPEDMLAYLEILEDPLTVEENIIEEFLESVELGQLFTRNQIRLLSPVQNQGYDDCSMDITYLNEMQNNNYKYVFLNAHGSPEMHMCNILDEDIQANPPNAMFYEFRSCSVGDYSKENYMAGWYVFSGEGLVANAASTIIFGATIADSVFNKYLARGLSFGESWLLSGSGLHSQIGDPTLKFERVIDSEAEIQLNLTKIDFRDVEVCNFSDYDNCNKKYVYVDIKNIGSEDLILEGGLAIHTKYKYSEWTPGTIGSEVETFFNLGSYSEIIIKPGEKITASVYFLPSLPGEYFGSYFITSNSKENSFLEVPFTVNKLKEVKKEIVIQNIEDCQGCFLEDSCIPYTIRSKDKYCSLDGDMIDQKSSKASCENNFECSSNICIDDQCISKGIWRRFLNWFRRLFGGE